MPKLAKVAIHVHDDPEFIKRNIASGTRRFVMFQGDKVHLFATVELTRVELTAERFAEFKPKVEVEEYKPGEGEALKIVKAIEANVSKAQTCKLWDGGAVAQKFLAALRSGEEFTEADLTGDEALPEPPAKVEQDGKKPSRKKKSAAASKATEPKPSEGDVYQPARGDRVCYITDKDEEAGTIGEVGSEQSEVKWDTGHSTYATNNSLKKLPPKAESEDNEKEAPVAKKSSTKKSSTKKAAKPAKPAKAPATTKEGKIAEAWGVREGSNRHNAIMLLLEKIGKKVLITDLSKAVYGNKTSAGPLKGVLKGVAFVINANKLPYVLGEQEGRGEEATITLSKK